jgi:hypothetical protein
VAVVAEPMTVVAVQVDLAVAVVAVDPLLVQGV